MKPTRCRLTRWLLIAATLALPLVLSAAAQAESGCHRNEPPAKPVQVVNNSD